MISREFVARDQELKQIARNGNGGRPHYDWSSIRPDVDLPEGLVEMLGEALTDVLAQKREQDIFSENNRQLIARVMQDVAREMETGQKDVRRAIERALVNNGAFDMARSVVMRRSGASPDLAEETPPKAKPKTKVIRRNNDAVPWNAAKIDAAVSKAFLSLHFDPAPAKNIADAITAKMLETDRAFINMEELQDLVQEELMRQGHYKVAEAYILYRAHHAELRRQRTEDETSPALEEQEELLPLPAIAALRKRIQFARVGLDLNLTPGEIEKELRRALFPEMTEEQFRATVILNAKSLIEKDADFAKFAGRILLTFIYEEVLGWDILADGVDRLAEFHRKAFASLLRRGVELKRVSPRLLEYSLDRLAREIDPAADLAFDYLGIQTLYDRYLIVDKSSSSAPKRLETPQLFWMRVAMGLFIGEKEHPESRVVALYRLYKSRRFCSSTPTLFNSGTLHSQLSSCYLYKVDDSIESIMVRGIAENAFLAKWAGGLGGSWTAVRGTGSYIHGTNGESQGVIPFLKLHNDQLVAVNQGGKRKGSGCAYLETWHNDVFDFLELRKNVGDDRRRTHDMNTANWIPDLFMKRMEARQDWTLFRSNETADLHELYGRAFEKRYLEYEAAAERGEIFGQKVPAIELWKQMLKMLFETGHPWITFKDPCNVRSPQDHCGVIHSSNLCTEITLNTSEEETAVCNLGSLVIENHLTEDGRLDRAKLRETIRVAVEALDNVIDINFYPTEAARTANMRHRPIGLGVMGLQSALYAKRVPFASEEAVKFNDEVMEAVAYYAFEASSDLAAKRGGYSTFQGSKWDRGLLPPDTLELLEAERGEPLEVPRGGSMDWNALREKIRKQGMRNSNVLAIAPTATISNIMGSTPCIEPAYRNLYVKSNLSGDFIVLNAHLVKDLKQRGLWSQRMLDRLKYFDGELADIEDIPNDLKQVYATAFSVPWEYLIRAAAVRQKWIDQSQSVNLFLAEPDLKNLSHMYRAAWRAGLKTTYYLRTLGASGIEKATVSVEKERRGVVAANEPEPPPNVVACRLDAMLNGGVCEACQ